MAACPQLGLLVTSDWLGGKLHVFKLPTRLDRSAVTAAGAGGGGACLALVCTLGGASSRAPMRFQFSGRFGRSGWMAFAGPAASRALLLTAAGQDAVHVIDVVARVHLGYVAAPGTIAGPRGVAARAPWRPSARGIVLAAATTRCTCSRAAGPGGHLYA